jgi:hypothetical protein
MAKSFLSSETALLRNYCDMNHREEDLADCCRLTMNHAGPDSNSGVC